MIVRGVDMATGNLPYLQVYQDRHGKWRYNFRRGGKTVKLPGNKLKKDFADPTLLGAYKAELERTGGIPPKIANRRGSLWHAVQDYYRSAEFRDLAASTKAEYRRSLEDITKKHGHRQFKQMRKVHIEVIRDEPLVMDGDEIVSGHGSAKNRVNALRGLCKWAVNNKIFEDNPTHGVKLYKVKRTYKRWEDEDIEAYLKVADEKATLAFYMLLYTGQRRGDAAAMTWHDYDKTAISVVPDKTKDSTGVKLWIPCHPKLKSALDKAPREGVNILMTVTGKVFTSKHLGHWISETMDKAGLRKERGLTVHGLRATAASKLAEAGCTDHEVMAVTGHSTLAMVQKYTAGAKQKVRAISAIEKLGK